jgi:hypothetical protein
MKCPSLILTKLASNDSSGARKARVLPLIFFIVTAANRSHTPDGSTALASFVISLKDQRSSSSRC